MRRFHIIACHVLWREFCYFASLSPNVFTFDFLKQGLHNEPDKLRQAVQQAVDAAEPASPQGAQSIPNSVLSHHNRPGQVPEAILLGYGLCSNGIMNIQARSVPIVVPRAHDCITFLLGSKERYREYFDNHPGTYWYSPGWIDTHTQPGPERFAQLKQSLIEKYGEDNADYLMELELGWMKKYTHATYVDLGYNDQKHYIQYTQDCAKYCNWQCDVQKGDPGLFQRLVAGDWKDSEFLVVPPGRKIVPSDDETVVKSL